MSRREDREFFLIDDEVFEVFCAAHAIEILRAWAPTAISPWSWS